MTGHDRPAEPQSGLLLFARVAQFTVLEGGIEPEIKALIRPDIEAYRQIVEDDDLDNNIPLNRTAVPHMRQWLLAQGQTPSDLNKLCRRLALEAIHAHFGEYAAQVWRDFSRLHLTFATKVRGPSADAALSTKKMLLAMADAHPTLHREATIAAIDSSITGSKLADRNRLAGYAAWVDTAWLFQCAPVLLTSLLLPVLIWRSAGAQRWWWLSLAVIWYFNGVLLSTVGKPLDRYLIPVMPIMFWALSSAVAAAWLALLAWLEQRSRPVSL